MQTGEGEVGRRRVPLDVLLPSVVLGTVLAMAVVPRAFTRADPTDCDLGRSLDPPSAGSPFGHDVFGCDHLAGTVHAARTSVTIAVLTVVGTVLIAAVVGSLAGYRRGWVDVLVCRLIDVWSAVPLLLGAVVVLSALRVRGVLAVSLVLVLFGWPAMARVQRASVLQVAGRDHVLAARALGASPARLLRRHVLPGALRPLLVGATTHAGFVIGIEATLTYLGVGLQQPALSWGLQLLQARDRVGQAPHLLLPAAVLLLAVGSLVLLGRALQHRSLDRDR